MGTRLLRRKRSRRVAILPIVATTGAGFVGVEYLEHYQKIERLDFYQIGTRFGRIDATNPYTGTRSGTELKALVRG